MEKMRERKDRWREREKVDGENEGETNRSNNRIIK